MAASQALDALRRADDDNRARASEIHSLRVHVAELQRALEAASEAKDRAENHAHAVATDLERQTLALSIVLKEVASTKESLRQQREENGRLRATIDQISAQTQMMGHMIAAKTATQAHEGGVAHSGPVQYMQYCYTAGTDPSLGILRSLHQRSAQIDAKDATFQQLAILADVLRADPDSAAAAMAVELHCTGDNVTVVTDIIARLKTVRRVTAVGVDDAAAEQLFGALRLQEHVTEVQLPDLCVSDDGLSHLWKCLQQRADLARTANGSGAGQALLVKSLDLSKCAIRDAATALAGLECQCLAQLSLSGIATLDRPTLRGVLMRCPAVTSLCLSNCPKLTSDVCEVINLCPLIRELDLVGSLGVTALRLDHVEVFSSTLAAVAIVAMPKLVTISTPVGFFQVIEWTAPLLETIAMNGVALGARECNLLSSSQALRNLSLVHCRVHNLDVLLKRMRRLESVSFNGCKGVTDNDVRSLCTSIVSADLTDSFLITDKAVQRFAECPHLKELCLKRCANVTDAGLAALDGHESLQQINLLGAKKVTVLAVHKLIESARSLQRVVHETVISTSVRVDREDEEESQRRSLTTQERAITEQRLQLPIVASPLRPLSTSRHSSYDSPRSDL